MQELTEVHQQLFRTTTEMYETVATALLEKVRVSRLSANSVSILLSFRRCT